MKKFILVFLIFGTIISCSRNHNPAFKCKNDDLNCDESLISGQFPLEADLNFTHILEQGYWYSRYNLGNLVMKSGMGESFKPNPEMVKKMIAMVSDEISEAKPAKNPALIKRIFNR